MRGLDSKATPLVPMLYGGGQEGGLRSGYGGSPSSHYLLYLVSPPSTENTGMIAGLGKAAELIVNHVMQYGCHMKLIRDYLEEELEVRCQAYTYGVHLVLYNRNVLDQGYISMASTRKARESPTLVMSLSLGKNSKVLE